MRACASVALVLLCGSSGAEELHAKAQQKLTDSETAVSFETFVRTHGRGYKKGTSEYANRFAIFSQRLEDMQAHNLRQDRLWTAGINSFADHTEAELSQLRGWSGTAASSSAARTQAGTSATASSRAQGSFLQRVSKASPLPRHWNNWTQLDSLSEVKHQSHCGSCWAVTGATVLEAHSEIHATPRSFSIQELVSCVPNPQHCGGDGGCHGATVELAFNYVMRHGLATEEDQPYKAKTGHCHRHRQHGKHHSTSWLYIQEDDEQDSEQDLSVPGVHLAGSSSSAGSILGMRAWERLPENLYAPLLRAVYERGPVAVSVDAKPWHFYEEGVFDGCGRNAVINHAVTLIGYGETDTAKYWTVQNSWGPDWGEDGRIRVLRHEGNDESQQHCGWDHHPEKGTACEDAPKKVKVCGMCGILYDSVVPHFS